MGASVFLTLYYFSMCANARRSNDKREGAMGRGQSKDLSKSSVKSITANLHSERELLVVKKTHKKRNKVKRHDPKKRKHHRKSPKTAEAKRKSPKSVKFKKHLGGRTKSTQGDEEKTEETQVGVMYCTDDGLDDTNLDAPSFEPILWPPSSDERPQHVAEKIGDEEYNTALEGVKNEPAEESKAAVFDSRTAAPTSASSAVNAEDTVDFYNFH